MAEFPATLTSSLCLGRVLLAPREWGRHGGQVLSGSREQDAEATQQALQMGCANAYFLS